MLVLGLLCISMLPFTLYCNCYGKSYEKKEISIGKKVMQSIHATRHASTVFHLPSQMLLDSISSLHFCFKAHAHVIVLVSPYAYAS